MEMFPEEANAIYSLLVTECGAKEDNRDIFIHTQTKGFCSEWRFMGSLGFGGKFYRTNKDSKWYISCYDEDRTDDIDNTIGLVNEKLEEMRNMFSQA